MTAQRNKVWQMLLPLVLVAGLSGLVVSVFYSWINPIIEARREQEVIELGLRSIFPAAARMKSLDIDDLPQGVEAPVYEVFGPQNEALGLMYYVTGQGWDTFRLAVGVDPVDKRLVGVRVLEHQETPGLGSAITEEWFLGQFAGKALGDPFRSGDDVQAITGATVSTRGVAQTVSQSARNLLEGMGVKVEVAASGGGAGAAEADTGASRPEAVSSGTRAARPRDAERIRQALNRALTQELDSEVLFEPAEIWRVKGDGESKLAWAVRIEEEGYGGPISVLTLVESTNTTVLGVEVLSHNETPGLGDAVTDASFLSQFYERSPEDSLEVGVDIDGITMATYSAEAVTRAVKRALVAVEAVGGYGGGQ